MKYWHITQIICACTRNLGRTDQLIVGFLIEIFLFVSLKFRWKRVQTNSHLKLVYVQELGDVENWAQSIESDMQTISSALEHAYKGKIPDSEYLLLTVLDLTSFDCIIFLQLDKTLRKADQDQYWDPLFVTFMLI